MCFGAELLLLAASAAASAGGKMMSNASAEANARAQADASNAVLDQFLARRKVDQEANTARLNAHLDTMTQPANTAAQEAAVAERGAAIDTAAPASTGAEDIPISGSTPSIVKSEIAKRIGDAFNVATENTKKAAKAASYGDVFGMNQRATESARRDIGVTNSLARDDAALLSNRTELARRAAYKTPSGFGDVLSGLGALGSMAAGSMFGSGKTG